MPDEEYLNESLRKIVKGAGIAFIGTGIGMFFAYLGMMIVARFLGPTDLGLISLASAIATIASTVVMIGMPEGVVRYVSFYRGRNDQGRIKGVIVSAFKVVLPLGIIASILLFLFADLISMRAFHDTNLTPILRIFSFSVPFFVLSYIFMYALGGFQEMKRMVYVRDLFQNSTRLFLLVVLLIPGYGVYGAAFAYTFAIIRNTFCSFLLSKQNIFGFSKGIKQIAMKKELFPFSLPSALCWYRGSGNGLDR
ncbi:MAG: oligosaccharide flippase family protein [archaeon]|nr:oligosaccharide flippase family protein [archaeon]